MTNPNEDRDLELVRKACESLGEHFDSVQIFTTRLESGTLNGTVSVSLGSGNWFARYGQVVAWVNKEDESSRMDVMKDDEP